MASMRPVAAEGLSETDSGIRKLTAYLRQKNKTEDVSPFASRAASRLELVRPRIEEAKSFIATTKRRIDLDDRAMHAEVAAAHLAVGLFGSLEKLYAEASKGDDSTSFKFISVAANAVGAYLRRGPVLQTNNYSTADGDVLDAQVRQRLKVAAEMRDNVCLALDGIDRTLGVDLPPITRSMAEIR